MADESDSRGIEKHVKKAIRDVLWEQSHYHRMLDALSQKGPTATDSERVLLGALLAGEALERDLLPCSAVDFEGGLHRAVFVACCVVEPGEANPRLAKIILAMEADGVMGVTVDELLRLREWCHGERLEPHIRNVAEAGAARRMARYLETMASDIRLGRLSAAEAEQRLNRKLGKPQARNLIPLRSRAK